MNDVENKILNMLLAAAIGDAMGMSTEFLSREKIRENHGFIDTFLPSQPNLLFKRNFPAYTVTDDTHNILMLMDVYRENNGRFDLESYISYLKRWIREDPQVSLMLGPSTESALRKLDEGVPLEETGITGTTNGLCMKVLPLAFLFDYREKDILIKEVSKLAKLTHNTQIAIIGSSVLVAVMNYLYQGGKNWEKVWDIAEDYAGTEIEVGFDMPSPSLLYRIQRVRTMSYDQNVDDFLDELYYNFGTGMETIETVPSVLAIAYYARESSLFCAQCAASVGGDTDTIAAIACPIVNAYQEEDLRGYQNKLEEVNSLSFQVYVDGFPYLY